MKLLLILAGLIGLVFFLGVVVSLDDIKRYLKLRAM